jgi:hypothetical protein
MPPVVAYAVACVVAPESRVGSGSSDAVGVDHLVLLRDTAAGTTSNRVEDATSVKRARSSGCAVQPSGNRSASLIWVIFAISCETLVEIGSD